MNNDKIKRVLLLVIIISFLSLTCCNMKEQVTLTASKSGVSEFFEHFKSTIYSDVHYKKENCYNVTPQAISSQTDLQFFSFTHPQETYIFASDEVISYHFTTLTNAFLTDLDKNGGQEVLFIGSSSLPYRKSIACLYDLQTKEILYLGALDKDVTVCPSEDNSSVCEIRKISISEESAITKSYNIGKQVGTVEMISSILSWLPDKPIEFSYSDDMETLKRDSHPVQTNGFVNVSKSKICGAKDAVQLAFREIKVDHDYNDIDVSYDSNAKVWRVLFGKKSVVDYGETLYVSHHGITLSRVTCAG